MCNSNKCSICECDEKEIPTFWKKQRETDESLMNKANYNHKLDFSKINRAKKD